MPGLLDGALNNPLINIGLGLLSAGGPSDRPVSIGQGLGQGVQLAQGAQQQNLRNQLIRSRLEDDSRRRGASAKLSGLLGGGDNPTLGLLTDIAPGAVAQGLIGQAFPNRRPDSVLSRLQAAGISPQSEEGRKLITNSIGGGAASEQLDILLKGLQVQSAQEKLTQGREEKSSEKATIESAALGSVENLTGLAEIINTSITGVRQGVANAQLFDSLANQEAIDSALAQLSQAGGITNSKLAAVTATKPNKFNLPEVNATIVANKLETLLRGAEKVGVNVGDKEKIRSTIKRMRGVAAKAKGVTKQPRIFNAPNEVPSPGKRRKGDVFNHPTLGTLQWNGTAFETVQ